MEHVQQAIAKAREERQGNIGRRRERIVSPDSQYTPTNSDTPAGEPINVTYVHTREEHPTNDLLHDHRVIAGFEHDRRVEAYRQMRAKVLRQMRENNWHSLAITSPGENAGKTLTAINLAIAISHDVNQTVLVVDLDLGSPSVSETLGVECEFGVVDYITGKVPLEDVLFSPGFERLVALPGTPQATYSSEILSSPAMLKLKDELENRYESRIIIYDLPPLLRNDDALIFTPMVDANLLVVEDGVSTRDDLQRCLRLLEGSTLMGTILNKARD